MTEIDLKQFEEHTPGPWGIEDCWIESDSGRITAVLRGNASDGALIAAAPTLLADLKRKTAEIARLEETIRTVERWANHHARKPATTAAEALCVIQHPPVIRAITAGYADGVIPSTPDPYAEIERLKEALHALTYWDNGKPEFGEARTLLVGWASND